MPAYGFREGEVCGKICRKKVYEKGEVEYADIHDVGEVYTRGVKRNQP